MAKENNKRQLPHSLSKRETDILFGLSVILLVGIFYSTALTTLCITAILFLGLRHITIEKTKAFFNDDRMMPFLLIFLAVFLSGGNTENQEAWHTALRVKLPFLLLPPAVFIMPRLKYEIIYKLHFALISIATIVGIPVCFETLIDYNQMIQLLGKGQPIPTPIEHVKYSMINAYAIIGGIVLYIYNLGSQKRALRILLLLEIVFLIILIHILAVRTGLVILYISLIFIGIYKAVNSHSIKMVGMTLSAVLLMSVIAFLMIPSLRQKVNYMRYDWSRYQEDGGHYYSDSERMMSYHAAWTIWKNNPIMGIGYGDIGSQAHLFYEIKYDRSDLFKLPHSQFLLFLSGSGILGFILFIAGFYTPILRTRINSPTAVLLVVLYINYTLSFLVENSLERSVSVSFFAVLALLLIKSDSDGYEISGQ